MKAKEQVGADIYIDDSPKNIRKHRNEGYYAICCANTTNEDVGDPRAESWEEVHQLIHQKISSK